MEHKDVYKHKYDFLLKAIDDTQNTIRFTDTKAMAVIGFWTLVINTLIRTKLDWTKWLIMLKDPLDYLVVYSLVVVLLGLFGQSLWLAYMVLVPKSAPGQHIESDGVETQGLFYLHEMEPKVQGKYLYQNSFKVKLGIKSKKYQTMLEGLTPEQIHDELAMELQKVSFIRNMKIARVNKAISAIIQSLIVFLLLAIFALGKEVILFEGGQAMLSFDLDMKLFIVLYIAHKIADYLLQTDYQARMKSTNIAPLITHCLIYTVTVMSFAYLFTGFFSWAAILVMFLSHLIIDNQTFLHWWAKYIKRMPEPSNKNVKMTLLELDQSFHYIVLFIISYLN